MKFFLTGVAGFVGSALARRLLEDGHEVFGIDNLADSYSPHWKRLRLDSLKGFPRFYFQTADITSPNLAQLLPPSFQPEIIVHLAAESGVRRSLAQPGRFLQTNVHGFGNVLELAQRFPISHFVFCSSSSVYGDSTPLPAAESQPLSNPLSTYAATKRANEMLAYVYARQFHLPCTGVRLFSVYGPSGRPDMSYFQFAAQITREAPISLFGEGKHSRDFTYIDDAVEAIVRLTEIPPAASRADQIPYRVVNVGTGNPIAIQSLVSVLEKQLGKKVIRVLEPRNSFEALSTHADTSLLKRLTGFVPSTPFEQGMAEFTRWFQTPQIAHSAARVPDDLAKRPRGSMIRFSQS